MKLLRLISFVLMTMATAGAHATRPEIIAHRGASAVAPENTVAAFKLAWEMGADAAETDVYLTADHEVVAIHDKTVDRTTGGQGAIKEMTLAQIRALDAGSWKGAKYAGEKIPTLAEVLATIPEGKRFYLEIKDKKEIVPYLKPIIEKSGKKDRITIIAFDKEVLAAAHAAMPELATKWLRDSPKNKDGKGWAPIDPKFVAEAKAAGFGGLNVSHPGVTPELIAAAKAQGMEVYVWTVDDPAAATRLVKMGVTGITTNAPDVMLKAFAAAKE